MKTLKVLSLLFAIVASFGCQPALYGNLRNDILSHNLPSLQVDLPIADPVTLELKEGITNRITGDCDVTVILSDKSKNERVEFGGTIFVENNVVRIAEAVHFRLCFKLKDLHIRVGNRRATITKSNIEEIFKKDNLKIVFNKYDVGITLNKETKEISFSFMDEIHTDKLEVNSFWDKFTEYFIKSPPIRHGNEIISLNDIEDIDLLKNSLKEEDVDIENFYYESEAKGIKKISGKNYLVRQLTSRFVGRFYDKKANEYEKVNMKVGGYKLYEIPHLLASKHVYTLYIDTDKFDGAIGILFDGNLSN